MGKWVFNPFTGDLDWTETAGGSGSYSASSIMVDTSAFTKNLSPLDVTVQHALNTIDQMSGGITIQQAIMYGMIGG